MLHYLNLIFRGNLLIQPYPYYRLDSQFYHSHRSYSYFQDSFPICQLFMVTPMIIHINIIRNETSITKIKRLITSLP